MTSLDEFLADIRRRRDAMLERWQASDDSRRKPGRRPRDPEQERLLADADRERLEQEDWWKTARRLPVEPPEGA